MRNMLATKMASVANRGFQKLTSESRDLRVASAMRSNTKVISPIAIIKCTTIGWMMSTQVMVVVVERR